ncbi:glycoside hydrolase family 2 protein [Propionibacteriaceae bacterium G1746]|uniref:glycoside hydrolase family 2 protein n=1 Tax=Aestuariimicrobium sp. G57 TaxID=3418485 RepID=UPI003C207D6B
MTTTAHRTTAARLACTEPASQGDGSYPRPTLVRGAAVLLDRLVGFAHDDDLVGLRERWYATDGPFTRQIQLPFPPESARSGIDEPGFHPCVWYRIELSADDLAAAGHTAGRRLLLHFGAVDYDASVWVDGQLVATHRGGQTPFGIDITDALDPSSEQHVVTVRAFDDPHDGRQPRGKQDWLEQPHAIWYRRTSGIWRTVWLESVPPTHLARVVWRPDISNAQVRAVVELDARPRTPVQVDLAIAFAGDLLAEASVTVAEQSTEVVLSLAKVTSGVDLEAYLWWPHRPSLMDAAVVVHGVDDTGDETSDEVRSYLGYREVGVNRAGLTLNSIPFSLRSVLEQGYWPQSCLTPPSVQAMKDEVALILELGFNSARIHQKVEDPRFLFFADTMGLTLWGETAAAYTFDSQAVDRLTSEWVDIVRANEVHPSVLVWVPFNESWGVTHISRVPAQAAFTRGLTELTRALDPTRPVVSNDGWEHTDSDLMTIHDYEWRGEVLAERYSADGLPPLLGVCGPAGRPLVVGDRQRSDVPVLLTEFGGVEFVTARSADETWGYSSASDAADYEARVRAIIEPVRRSPVLAGFCWTQLTDTLQEANGLCDEFRVPKLPVETLRALIKGHGDSQIPIETMNEVIKG